MLVVWGGQRREGKPTLYLDHNELLNNLTQVTGIPFPKQYIFNWLLISISGGLRHIL